MSGRSASCRSFEQRKRQQLTRFYVKEQAVNQNQLRRFGVNVDLRLDTDTCFIDVASWIVLGSARSGSGLLGLGHQHAQHSLQLRRREWLGQKNYGAGRKTVRRKLWIL